MPWLFKKCLWPQCQEKILTGSYCDTHKKQKQSEYDATRDPDSTRFYNSRRWKLLRQMKLNKNPLCEICLLEGKIQVADMVDHVDGDFNNNDEDNHMSLCNACHNKKHKAGQQPANTCWWLAG